MPSEQLAGRFEDLDIKDSNKEGSEKEYVYVVGEMETPPQSADGNPTYGHCEATVSISTIEQWEKELLEDPKVCLRPPTHSSTRLGMAGIHC